MTGSVFARRELVVDLIVSLRLGGGSISAADFAAARARVIRLAGVTGMVAIPTWVTRLEWRMVRWRKVLPHRYQWGSSAYSVLLFLRAWSPPQRVIIDNHWLPKATEAWHQIRLPRRQSATRADAITEGGRELILSFDNDMPPFHESWKWEG